MYRPSGSGRDLYLAEKHCRTHPHYISTHISSIASVTRMNISKVLPSGSGRDIYLMSSPPTDTIRDQNGRGAKRNKYNALFTESIFPANKHKRPQSATTSNRKKETRDKQNNYMSTLARSPSRNKKSSSGRSSYCRQGSSLRSSNNAMNFKKKEKNKPLLQRQKFKDATTGRFKGAYFGGLRYHGSVSHGNDWK